MQKRPLLGLTLSELQNVVKNLGMPGFSAKQIASWLYDKKVTSIDEMSNLSLKHRELLKEIYEVGAEAPVDAMRSVDGTVKYLYRAGEGHFVEAVYIPDEDRATLCVSSQVGCKMNCKFCMTGKQGFTANLTSNQIINQINSLPERDKLTNVVMMGMGEPLDNLDEVLKALEIMTASYDANNKESKKQNKKGANMEIVHLTKTEFLNKVYNYETNPNDWKYEGQSVAR